MSTVHCTTSASDAPAAARAMAALSMARADCSAMSLDTIAPVSSTPFWPPTRMVVAPAGTMATWLNAGLATRPVGCNKLISMWLIVPGDRANESQAGLDLDCARTHRLSSSRTRERGSSNARTAQGDSDDRPTEQRRDRRRRPRGGQRRHLHG